MTNYNPTTIGRMTTEQIERKLVSAQARLKAAGNGHRGEAYYKTMAREQAVKAVGLYGSALADRKAGLV